MVIFYIVDITNYIPTVEAPNEHIYTVRVYNQSWYYQNGPSICFACSPNDHLISTRSTLINSIFLAGFFNKPKTNPNSTHLESLINSVVTTTWSILYVFITSRIDTQYRFKKELWIVYHHKHIPKDYHPWNSFIFPPRFLIAKSMQMNSGIFPHFVLFSVYENG